MNCILKSAKAKHNHNTVNIKFGMHITCEYKETMMSDADNGNTNWKGAELIELNQIYNFDLSIPSDLPLALVFSPVTPILKYISYMTTRNMEDISHAW